MLLAAYNYNIVYKSTKSHANANRLSRLPLPDDSSAQCPQESSVFNVAQTDTLPVTAKQLKVATSKDPILSKVLLYQMWMAIDNSTSITTLLEMPIGEDECIMWGDHVVIPIIIILCTPICDLVKHGHNSDLLQIQLDSLLTSRVNVPAWELSQRFLFVSLL